MDYMFSAPRAKLVACEAVLPLTSSPFLDLLSFLLSTEKPTYCISMGSNFYLSNSIYQRKCTFPQMGNDGIAHWDMRLLREALCGFDWMLLLSELFTVLQETLKVEGSVGEKPCMCLGCIFALLSCSCFSSSMKESSFLRPAHTYHSLYHGMRTSWTTVQL